MDQAHNLTEVLERSGLSFPQLCSMMGNEITSTALFRLSDQDYAEYHRLFSIFDQSRSADSGTKGVALENLASFLLSRIGIYEILRNKRTSTNEMDVVLVKKLGLSNFGGDVFPRHVICECKNYGAPISVTYVGKFYSLLKVSGVSLGLMISDSRISGQLKWKDGSGLCRKIALRDETFIINLSYEDLKLIDKDNVSILKLINDKIDAIKLDISISYDKHELCGDSEFVSMNSDKY